MENKTKIGLVGCGGMMGVHADRLLKRTDCEISALCDINQNQLENFKEKFPALLNCPTFTTHQELYRANLCDAVLIATPHTSHKDQVIQAFQNNLHVLCEKPLATTTADVLACIESRNQSGKIGALAYQRHGEGPFIFIKEIVDSGRYGKLRAINSHLGQQWYQFTAGSWRHKLSESGGGQINDSGSHMIDVLLWISSLQAKSVTAFMDNLDTEVDINSVVNIEFNSGAFGSLTIVGDAALWHERHYFWFEEAMVALADNSLSITTRDGQQEIINQFPDPIYPTDNFLDTIRSTATPQASFENGAATISLTEAAWKSGYGNNQPIPVTPIP